MVIRPQRWTSLWSVALAAALPMVLFALFVAGLVVSDTRTLIEQRYTAAARALLSAVDAELLAQIKTLQGLATSPALQAGDLAAFHEQARRFVAGHGDWFGLVLVDVRTGQQILNTGTEFGAPLDTVFDPVSMLDVAKTGKPVISPLIPRGKILPSPFLILRVPIFQDGVVVQVLSAVMDPAAITAIMRRQGVSSDYLMTVCDSQLHLVSSSRAGRFVGREAQESLRERARSGGEGLFVDHTLGGNEYLRVLERSPLTGWYVAVGTERRTFEGALLSAPLRLVAGGLAALALSAIGAVVLGRRFADKVAAAERRLADDLRQTNHQLIAARRDAEDRAIRAESLEADLKGVMDVTPAAILISRDPSATIITGNCAANRLFRIEDGANASFSAPDQSHLRLSLWQDGCKLAPADLPVRRAARGEEVLGYEMELRFDDGGSLHLYGNAVPLRGKGGLITGAVGAFIDVTARRQAEAAIAESEKCYRTLFDMAPISVMLVDVESGRLVDFNRRAHEDRGYSREEFSHLHVWDVNPTYRKEAILSRLQQIAAGDVTVQVETQNCRKDGSLIDVLVVAHPVLLRQRSCIYSMQLDISELKRAQHELGAAKTEAERANSAKSHFLAAASHDLRQPLQALNLYLAVLSGRLAAGDEPLMQHVDHCLSSLSELLNDLLDLSKLDAGVVSPKITEFPVDDILDKVISAEAPAARRKGLALRRVGSSLTVRTDPVLFGRALGNLLSNAVRYTEKGAVLVGCRRRHGKLWVEVWDTGIGIPQDKIPEIFEEFKQLGNDERSREKGSGLGLAIVRKTVSLLGLEIRVASRVGRGSVFAVELPRGQTGRLAAPSPLAAVQRPLRIAVVEDEPAVRQSLVLALEDSGHDVIGAANGSQIIARLGTMAPDLVVADYRLAGAATGLEVVTALRAVFGEEVRAMILTGDTAPAIIGDIVANGLRVLHKPVKFATLRDAVAEEARACAPARERAAALG